MNHVQRTWSEKGRRIEDCKDGDDRWIKLAAPAALEALRAHLETMDLEAQVRGWSHEQRRLIFPNTFGRIPRFCTFLMKFWIPLLKLAKLPYRSPHAMRHSYATWMLEDRADLRYVKDQLGHASIEETEGTYGHLERRRHEAAADLGAYLRPVTSRQSASIGPGAPAAGRSRRAGGHKAQEQLRLQFEETLSRVPKHVVGLRKAEPDLRSAELGVGVERRAGHRRHPHALDEPHRERRVVLHAVLLEEVGDVGQDVVGALGLPGDEPRLLDVAVEQVAPRLVLGPKTRVVRAWQPERHHRGFLQRVGRADGDEIVCPPDAVAELGCRDRVADPPARHRVRLRDPRDRHRALRHSREGRDWCVV